MAASKAEFFAANSRLKQQERAAYIQFATCLQHSPLCQDIVHYLVQTERLAEQERAQEQQRVAQHLEQLSQQISALRDVVYKRLPNTKTLLLTVDGNLQAARQGWISAREVLDYRCRELSAQIQQGFAQFNAVSKAQAERSDSDLPCKQQRKQVGGKSALQVIDNELQRIGYPTNGWPQSIHDSFYALWLNSKKMNRRRFAESIAQKFPEYTVGALLRHDDFCYKMEELLLRKKTEIYKWKMQRQKAAEEIEQQYEPPKPQTLRSLNKGKQAQLLCWREQKLMAAEDYYSFRLRESRVRQEQAKTARMRALKAVQARYQKAEVYRQLLQEQFEENERLLREEQAKRRMGILSQSYLEHAKRQEAYLLRQKERIQAIYQQNRAKEEEEKQQLEKKLKAQTALQRKIVGDDVVADFERLIRPTSAQDARIREVAERRRTGQRFGGVNVGYDPFAVVPISGGRAAAKW